MSEGRGWDEVVGCEEKSAGDDGPANKWPIPDGYRVNAKHKLCRGDTDRRNICIQKKDGDSPCTAFHGSMFYQRKVRPPNTRAAS